MSRKRQNNAPPLRPAEPVTLAGVLTALEQNDNLSATRRRDLVSAVRRVASLLGDEPAAIPLDMGAISARLAGRCDKSHGDVMAAGGLRDRIFIATRLEAPDPAELKRSLSRLRTDKLDLLHSQCPRYRDIEHSRSSGTGRRRAPAAISASRRPAAATIPPSRQYSGARSRISCNRLFPRQPRSREPYPAAGGGGWSRCADCLAVRARPPVPQCTRHDARLGTTVCGQLGTVFPEVPGERSARDRGHPWYRRHRSHDRQHWRHAGSATRPRPAPTNGYRKSRVFSLI